jgi:glucose-1-phosphate thymidylyltransferase
VAELGRSGQIVGLAEKPDDPASDLAIVGVYMFTPAVHDAVRAIRPSARGELEITDAVQWLINNGHHVHSHLITGYWKDTGRVQDMLECNRIVLESIETRIRGTVDDRTRITGRVVIEPGAVVEDSVLRGPVVIGADTKVVGSYVGPFTSIGDGCSVEEAEIEYSIVMSDSTVRGVSRIESSLIGKGVEVTPARSAPNTHQLVIGDHSTVRLRG